MSREGAYIIKYASGEYVGIDAASGGYPYPTNYIQQAKFWATPELAKEYKMIFKEETWTLHSVYVDDRIIEWS